MQCSGAEGLQCIGRSDNGIVQTPHKRTLTVTISVQHVLNAQTDQQYLLVGSQAGDKW